MAGATLKKICTKCNKELPLDEFERRANAKDGRRSYCRDCQYEKRLGRVRRPKKHRVIDGVAVKACARCGVEKPATTEFFSPHGTARFGVSAMCRPCGSAYVIERRKVTDPDNRRLVETATAWRKANRDRHNAAAKRSRENRTEERKASHRDWSREYGRAKRARDPQYRFLQSVRAQVSMVVRGKFDGEGLLRRLGYSRAELMAHIEKQFQPGMSWDNYGKLGRGRVWELDHIRPCASFDLSVERQFQECWSLSNLRPLWAKENRSKGAKPTHLL